MRFDRRPQLLAALLLALVVGGSGALAGPTLAAPRIHYGVGAWLSIAADASNYLPGLTSAIRGVVGPSSIDYGTDGRLSVMVIGSDYRPGRSGERMDAVMVATINPSTHQVAAVSIPRDTGAFQMPNNDPWKGKVNSMYSHFRKMGYDRIGAFDQMRLALGHILAVEVDYTVFARFTGFDFLVDQLGTVPNDIPLEIRDSRYYDDKDPTTPRGALFTVGTDVPLGGDLAVRCIGNSPLNWSTVTPCYRALVYVRTRHGTVGNKNNNNYKRDKRQQSFLMSAVARTVAMLGADPNSDQTAFDALDTLRDTALGRMADPEAKDFWTDLPISDDADLLELFNLFNGAQDQVFLQVTLKPNKYAYHVRGTRKYALKLDVVRALTAQWFAPVP